MTEEVGRRYTDDELAARRSRSRAPLDERLARYEQMKNDRAAGMSLEEIGYRYDMSKERARQVLSGPPPLPAKRPLTRVAQLEAKIEKWRAKGGESVVRVADLEAELADVKRRWRLP